MKKIKGFTLIELMIVLAIIVILSIVLIPKASIFKNQAKNSGVATNVNTVRAYLENKTGVNFIDKSADLKSSLDTAFSGEDVLTNPLDSSSAAYVVSDAEPSSLTKGSVVVVVNSSSKSYTIYGVDSSTQKINSMTIK